MIMLIKVLNDVKQGHYLWMRRKNTEEIARIGNFGVLLISLFGYYVSFWLFGFAIFHRLTGRFYKVTGFTTDFPVIFGPYLLIYLLLINPYIKKDNLDENLTDIEKEAKKRVAKIYFIVLFTLFFLTCLSFNFIANG